MALLKRDHGIEVKSASSTIEEVVGRQFVDRLARQRGVTLPSGDIFAERPAPPAAKKPAFGKKVEPPKPPAPTLGPPRLVKTVRPPIAEAEGLTEHDYEDAGHTDVPDMTSAAPAVDDMPPAEAAEPYVHAAPAAVAEPEPAPTPEPAAAEAAAETPDAEATTLAEASAPEAAPAAPGGAHQAPTPSS